VPAAGGPPLRASQRWKAFALLVVTYFIAIVDFTIVNVALTTIGRELRFPESDLQWLVTAYGLTFAGFLLLGGRAADLLGRRRVLMAGLAVFTAASLAGGLATSDILLIVMRGIQGLGTALVLPAALSIVTNMFSEGPERNKALGIWGWVGALGGTVGLLAGGILTTYAGPARTPTRWPTTATQPPPPSPAGSSGPVGVWTDRLDGTSSRLWAVRWNIEPASRPSPSPSSSSAALAKADVLALCSPWRALAIRCRRGRGGRPS
jgi:MFS family permease